MNEKWDYLIILDACRYDYFFRIYNQYFKGVLEKVKSPASSTSEWCKETFKGYYEDIIYISGNPYINSKIKIKGFDAKRHFLKVIDVWDYGWDEKIGTVHPKKINEALQKYKSKYPNKRFIIHYLQPHAPYIHADLGSGFPRTNLNQSMILSGIQDNRFNNLLIRIRCYIQKILFKQQQQPKIAKKLMLIYSKLIIKMRTILRLPPESPMDSIRHKYGKHGLRLAYSENLKLVLSQVANLMKKLQGKIVITADHGELLGEEGYYSHFPGSTSPLLIEVPWLKIQKISHSPHTSNRRNE